MINENTQIEKTIIKFEEWFYDDDHSKNQDYYKNSIKKSFLKALTKEELIDFFYNFIIDGGKIQSGGHRTKNIFLKTIKAKFKEFRKFILGPFSRNFDLEDWFNQISNFSGFGVGIATIYLNRLDNDSYPIMNNKTIAALNKLGYQISSTKNFKNYQVVKNIQDKLIKRFPKLDNYYKTDAFNHFIVAVYNGVELISDLIQIRNWENELEQKEIQLVEEFEKDNLNKRDLLKKIEDIENEHSELVTVKGKRYKRHNYLMCLIKKYRNYKCQFCSTKIRKSNGEYYIEACHIKPKAKGGLDKLENILVLCPNCHKRFDYGTREEEKLVNSKYSVKLNGEKYTANISIGRS